MVVVVKLNALGMLSAEDVTEQGDCWQVNPDGAEGAMVTGDEKPLAGVIVREKAGVIEPT